MYQENYLSHHGIKGQKWGVRRFQNPDGTLTNAGKKKKAKEYQKEFNRMQTNSNDLLLDLWQLNETKANNDKKIKNNKNNVEKAKEFIEENKIVSMKMKDLGERYHKQEKEINDFLNKVYNDKDVVYRFSRLGSTGGSIKNNYNTLKEMSSKYGKHKWRLDNPGSAYSVEGDKIIVKPGTEKYKKKDKYSDDSYKKRRGQRMINTTYYYY